MTGKDTDRSPTVSIDVHRPWRGELLEREPALKSLHTHPPRTVEFRPGRAPRSYGDENGSFHGGVKRLGVRGGSERAAGWEPASVLAGLGFTWRGSLAGIGCERQRWITNGRDWRRL